MKVCIAHIPPALAHYTQLLEILPWQLFWFDAERALELRRRTKHLDKICEAWHTHINISGAALDSV